MTNLQLYLLDPLLISSLLFGAMIPYAFSAMTMKSVGQAAQKMVNIIINLSVLKLKIKF